MGIIKRGILGGFSGKVAGVVGSSWKGIATIKALPLSVANPKTALQVANRTAFKQAVLDASTLLVQIVKPQWDRDAQLQSGYNAFVSANKQAYSNLGVLDVTKFIVSLGKLPETAISSFAAIAGSTNVTIEWVDDSGVGEKLASDIAFVTVFNETQNVFGTSTGLNTRDSEQAVVVMPASNVQNDVISVWLSFQGIAADKKKYAPGSDLSNTVQ